MNWIVEPEYISSLIVLILYFYSRREIGVPTERSRVFRLCLWTAFLSIGFNLICVYTVTHSHRLPLGLNYLLNSLYFIVGSLVSLLISCYVLLQIYAHCLRPRRRKMEFLLLLIPYLALVALVASTFSHHLVFSFDAQLQYTRGPLNAISYALYTWDVAVILLVYFRHRKQIDNTLFHVLLTCIPVSLGILLVQLFSPDTLLTGTAMALILLILFIHFQQNRSNCDALTGLFSRETFYHITDSHLHRRYPFGVLIVSLRNFRTVNTHLGFQVGDAVLRQVADYLRTLPGDIQVCRFSGVEFALIVPNPDAVLFERLVHQVFLRFCEPWDLPQRSVTLSAALADISCPDNAQDVNYLIEALEYALTISKTTGQPVRFDRALAQKMTRRTQVTALVKRSLKERRFYLNFQPIFDSQTRRMVSGEALLRLKDDAGQPVSPGEFIPLAEENGQIVELSWLVLEMACEFLSHHPETACMSLSINFSFQQFQEKDMAGRVLRTLECFGVRPSQIKLEITERTISEDTQRVLEVMRQLSQGGVGFYLDDFGTGYSNLANVARLPFECIKIDKSLVDDCDRDNRAFRLLETIIRGFRDTGVLVLAEGVETYQQFRTLQHLSADRVQGFYFARPLDPETYLAQIREENAKRREATV